MSEDHDNLNTRLNTSFDAYYSAGADAIIKDDLSGTESICHLFESCVRRYGTLLLALQTDILRPTRLIASLLPEVKDEFSRLRIWGEQTYAILPPNARRSLDEQLRENDETKQIVVRSLRRLNGHIERAFEQTKRYSPTTDANTEDVEYSSLSDESDASQETSETLWETRFRKTINSAFEGIRSLYRVSVLLRRPRNSTKYLKSSNSAIPSHDALRVTLDYAHVSEKIRQWRHLTMRSKVGEEEEQAVTEEEMQLRNENEFQEIADIAFFCQRLTWANLFRRKQFDYWVDYPDVPEPQDKALDTVDGVTQRKGKMPSAIHASLSTVAKSALGDSAELGQWRTVYAKSEIGGRSNTTRVPDVPKCSKTDPNFECPFCHIILDSKAMQKRETWKKHVFRDLRPYVCNFEKCPDPGRLFITRHDWIYHEQQMHRRKWVCPDGCLMDLMSKVDMVQHLLACHPSDLNERQISTSADMCEREMDDSKSDTCLICSEKMSLSRLYQHLATHMEEIALFVLPMDPDADEDEQIEEITEDEAEYAEEPNLPLAKIKLKEDEVVRKRQKYAAADQDDEHERKPVTDTKAVVDAETIFQSRLELQAMREEREYKRQAYDDFLRKQREQEEAEEIEHREPLNKQKEKEEDDEKKYQAFLYLQKEKQEAEDKARREEEARIDSAIRASLEKLDLSQDDIGFALESGKPPKRDHRRQSEHEYLSDLAYSAPIHKPPVYPRINRKYLDIETLEHYDVPWEWDRSNPEYMILLRELENYETDMLFEHTRRRRGSSAPSLIDKDKDSGPKFAWVRRKSKERSNSRERDIKVTEIVRR